MYLLLFCRRSICSFVFFNNTPTTEIYTLSLHDALPISELKVRPTAKYEFNGTFGEDNSQASELRQFPGAATYFDPGLSRDRKSTRLNSSHQIISYAVFCLKKKKHNITSTIPLTMRQNI